jgi:ribosome modulation factor
MTNKGAAQVLPPAKNLQRAFECAVQDIYQAGLTGKVSQYRTPIVQRAQRAGTVSGSYVGEEKRAVSDAAKALALLWKVSPNFRR